MTLGRLLAAYGAAKEQSAIALSIARAWGLT